MAETAITVAIASEFSAALGAAGTSAVLAEGAICAEAAVVSNGLVFGLSGLACLGILAGVAVVAGVSYFVYKRCSSETNPSPLVEQHHQQAQNIQERLPIEQMPADYVTITQQQARSVSTISTEQFKQAYQELKCPITLALMVDPISLNCGHSFSSQPLEQHLTHSSRCPLCHQQVTARFRVEAVTKFIERFKKKAIKRGRQWAQARIDADFDVQFL